MSRLYTINKWNRKKFLNKNIFDDGGVWDSLAQKDFQKSPWNYSQDYLYGGSGPSITEQYKNSKNGLGISKESNPFSKGNIGGTMQSIGAAASTIPETPFKLGNTTYKRGLWDAADPLYQLAGNKENVVGNTFSDAGVSMTKAGLQSGNGWVALAGGITKALGSLINAGWGIEEDKSLKAGVDAGIKYNNNFMSTAGSFDDLVNPYAVVDNGKVYTGGWFTKGKARRKNEELKRDIANAKSYAEGSVGNNIYNINDDMRNYALRNYAAFGGPLGNPFIGYPGDDTNTAVGYDLANYYLTTKKAQAENKGGTNIPNYGGIYASGGKIHINPKNKGKFNATKKRTGKTTEELTHSKNPLTRKRAIFAQNARKWRHDFGGPLFAFGGDLQTNGSDFPTGLTHISTGGSHESNPYEGVQMGVDRAGVPNLVEENEVVYDDYVFSNRIPIDQSTKDKFHIGKKREMTFADLAKKLEKEIAERPNDPLSEAGFNAQMQTLQEEQERQKQEMEAERARQAFEALSPEEQVAIMDRANQEEQMAQQAMQEQAIAQEAAEQQGMIQQPTPEEAAMMEQQVPQEQMAMAAPQEMAYGGNLYAPGGTLDVTEEDISLIRRLFGNNRFTEGFEKTGAFLADPVDYMFGDDIEAAVAKLASLSQPQLEKFFNTSVGQRVAELIDAASSDSNAQKSGIQRWARATGRLQRPVQRTVVTAAKKALAQSKQVARRQMKVSPKGASKPLNATQSEVNAVQQTIRGSSNIPAGYSTNAGPATVTTVGSGTRVPLNNAYTGQVISRPTPADWGSELAGTMKMRTPYADLAGNWVNNHAGALGVAGVAAGTAGVAPLVYSEAKDVLNQRNQSTQLEQPNVEVEEVPNVEEPIKEKKAYKALDGHTYSTKAAALNANKKYLREHPNSQKQEGDVVSESELEGTQPEATAQNSAQAAPQPVPTSSATSTSATPATSAVPATSVVQEPVAEVTTTGGYPVNGVVYPTEEEAIAAAKDYATNLYNNTMNGTVGTQPEASAAPEIVEEEWAKENPMIAAPSNNVPTASWIPEWIPEDQKRDWTEVTTPTATAATAARVGRTKGTNTNGEDIPAPKDNWMRYAGLFGPAVGLGLMAAGVGKPDYSRLDAALASLGEPVHADWKPIGNYLTYRPMDIWYEQNRLNANARATDRYITNNAAPIGTKMAGLIANAYNNQLASGNLFRQALEYNDNKKAQVEGFNRGTDQFNSQAYNQNSMFNAQADNMFNQAKARLGLAAAQTRLDNDAGWYNSLYGNIGGLFKGIGDLGRDKTEKNWLEWLEKRGAFGNTGKAAYGGKIKPKKHRRGFTY